MSRACDFFWSLEGCAENRYVFEFLFLVSK